MLMQTGHGEWVRLEEAEIQRHAPARCHPSVPDYVAHIRIYREFSDKSGVMWQVALSWLVVHPMNGVRALDMAVRAGLRC